MAAGSIIVDLLMRTGSFETDTKRAEKRLAEMKKEAEKVGAAIGVAFVAVGAASVALVKNAIDAADATSKLAQQTGTTVEELSALTYAAGLADVSQEELGGALVKLTKNMSDAARGTGEAIEGFDALRISVKNADGTLKSSDQVLAEIADRFAGFSDGAEKTALAVNLFGRSGAQLIPLLNAGAAGLKEMKEEAARLGLVLDTDMARSAEEFNDNLTRIGQSIKGIATGAATQLLPALNDVSKAFVDVAKSQAFVETSSAIVKAAIDGLIVVFQTLSVVGSDVGFVFLSVGREIGAWAAQINALARGDLQGFRAISDAVKADGERARAELDKFQARVMAIGRGGAGSLGAAAGINSPMLNAPARTAAPRMASKAEKPEKPKITDAERYLESLRKQLQGTHDLTAAETVLSEIQSGRLGKVTAAQEKTMLGLASEIDATKEAQRIAEERASARKKEYDEINDFVRAQQEADAARLKSLTAGTSESKLKEAISDIQFLNSAYERGAISVEMWAEAVVASTGKLQAQGEEIDEFTKNMAQNIQGYLGESLANAMEGNFDDIGSSFTKMLNRMVAEAIAADLTRRLMGSAVQGGSGEGWIGAAVSAIGTAFGGAKAGGGDVMPGREYWVGENGPEKFRPRSMGTVLPANASAPRRSFNQTLNFNIPGGVDRRTVTQIGAEVYRSASRAGSRNN